MSRMKCIKLDPLLVKFSSPDQLSIDERAVQRLEVTTGFQSLPSAATRSGQRVRQRSGIVPAGVAIHDVATARGCVRTDGVPEPARVELAGPQKPSVDTPPLALAADIRGPNEAHRTSCRTRSGLHTRRLWLRVITASDDHHDDRARGSQEP